MPRGGATGHSRNIYCPGADVQKSCTAALRCRHPRRRGAPKRSPPTGASRGQGKYDDPVALGGGRGCAQAAKIRWVCTAHIQNPKNDADIYGAVTLYGDAVVVNAHLNHGNQITDWFTKTARGCQTNSCKGTRYHGW